MASASSSATQGIHYYLSDAVHTGYRDLQLTALSFPREFNHAHGGKTGWELRKRGGLLDREAVRPLEVPMLVAEKIDYFAAIAITPSLFENKDTIVFLIAKYVGKFPMISTSLFPRAVQDIRTHTCHTFRPHSGSIPESIPSIAIRALLKKEPGKYVVPLLDDCLDDENLGFHLFWGRYPFPGDASPRDAASPSLCGEVPAPLALLTDGYDTDEEDQNTSKTPLPDPTTSSISAVVLPTDPFLNYEPYPEKMFHFHLSFDFIEPKEKETLMQAAERELPAKRAAMHQFLTEFAAKRAAALPASSSSSSSSSNSMPPPSSSSSSSTKRKTLPSSLSSSSSAAASESTKKHKPNPATASAASSSSSSSSQPVVPINPFRIPVMTQDTGMRRAGIELGTTVSIDCTQPLKSGKIALVKINGSVMFRRFISDTQGARFEADDEGFPTFLVGPTATVQVIGVATSIEKPL